MAGAVAVAGVTMPGMAGGFMSVPRMVMVGVVMIGMVVVVAVAAMTGGRCQNRPRRNEITFHAKD